MRRLPSRKTRRRWNRVIIATGGPFIRSTETRRVSRLSPRVSASACIVVLRRSVCPNASRIVGRRFGNTSEPLWTSQATATATAKSPAVIAGMTKFPPKRRSRIRYAIAVEGYGIAPYAGSQSKNTCAAGSIRSMTRPTSPAFAPRFPAATARPTAWPRARPIAANPRNATIARAIPPHAPVRKPSPTPAKTRVGTARASVTVNWNRRSARRYSRGRRGDVTKKSISAGCVRVPPPSANRRSNARNVERPAARSSASPGGFQIGVLGTKYAMIRMNGIDTAAATPRRMTVVVE